MTSDRGFGIYLDRTLKKILLAYQRAFQENNIDLTIEQWVILQRVHELGENASQVEIAKASYRNRATTSRVIRGLSKKGLIEKARFKGDQKRFKLVITEEGKSLLRKVLPIAQELRKVGYEHIAPEKFTIFLEILDQIWHNYDALEHQPEANSATERVPRQSLGW